MTPPRRADVLLDDLREALRARLLAIAPHIAKEVDVTAPVGTLLDSIARVVKRADLRSHEWLLFIALTAIMPTSEQLSLFRTRLAIATDATALVAVLDATLVVASSGTGLRKIELVGDSTIVDVTFCAQSDHNTGIQRVVRETMPAWHASAHLTTFVAWVDDSTGFRRLGPGERYRVLDWYSRTPEPPSDGPINDPDQDSIVVPWGTPVFIPEVPSFEQCNVLACLAESSANPLSMIGYDAIPLVSAEGQSSVQSDWFARYLTVVRGASAIAAISESAAEEFRGYGDATHARGYRGARVAAISLATEGLDVPLNPIDLGLPLVLCVGSHEPRKNQNALLHAAEMLYAQGKRFELVFVGGGDSLVVHEFDLRIRKLRAKGLPIRSLRKATDEQLHALYRHARFSVFISTHEGYGLPVAESLAVGTPVLTSNFGSVFEIATSGGCVVVDPRDDEAITSALSRMLTDDVLISELRAKALDRPTRTWQEYSQELWAFLHAEQSCLR